MNCKKIYKSPQNRLLKNCLTRKEITVEINLVNPPNIDETTNQYYNLHTCINLRCGPSPSSKFKRMVKYERASVQMSEIERTIHVAEANNGSNETELQKVIFSQLIQMH
ncbi:Hypothetical_protein [Hexamita inflata]|uniref:Hypothetical_protein n=1 Tax=Hexamita inflata TaxID=28002 RepID=A0AA86QNH7_9EUKA|nr:Hypothetical protein HINF_LOCUS44872 [Hexamita inflata]